MEQKPSCTKITSDLPTAFLKQAEACRKFGSPFMGRLMVLLAENWPDDTALAGRFARWDGDLGPAGASLPLRVAGGLHALVLMGRDARLAASYPPNQVDDAQLCAAVLDALRKHDDFLCEWTERPPQTNEVRRSAVLIAAAHWLDARFGLPLQLSELGASAGLNLMFDRFALDIAGQRWGPQEAGVQLKPDWQGPLPPQAQPRITDRRGVDLTPLQVGQPEDDLRLIAYLWPDQPERLVRTRAAMALQEATIDRGDAADWLEARLASGQPDCLHLVFHTIAWQYFPPERQARGRDLLESAGRTARADSPLAWLAMEDDGASHGAAVSLRLWPGDLRLNLGRVGFHGQWIEWADC
ncbi:MAG: DUF2332 domain-containing protein [Pseudomonadota bacterium]